MSPRHACSCELDGLTPWHIASEPFAEVLDARARLVEAMWRGELVHGATIEIGAVAYVVGFDTIKVRATDEVVAELSVVALS